MYGDSLRSCTVAIVVPQPDKVEAWAKEHGKTPKDAYTDPGFKALIMDEIKSIGVKQKLSGLEKPKDVTLTEEAFSVENNLLTPTFKLKRNIARDHFKP